MPMAQEQASPPRWRSAAMFESAWAVAAWPWALRSAAKALATQQPQQWAWAMGWVTAWRLAQVYALGRLSPSRVARTLRSVQPCAWQWLKRSP
ncbi:MAG: hypothetical protein NTZ05_22085 [Chloroflexi bacterium]|nr:hypothetical protein [Chloroflexota bacterium]